MISNKVNKAKIRRDTVAKLVQLFKDSGVEYGCGADVINTVRPEALKISGELLSRGINLSKSNYPMVWKANMADMFAHDAWKQIHKEIYGE